MIIAIVDDCKNEAKELEKMLSVELDKLNIQEYDIFLFFSGVDFLHSYRPGLYSLIFLDIFMGTFSGIDIAKLIRETDSVASLVFFTTSNEFASQSYEVGASYYIHKPVNQKKISFMLRQLNLIQMKQKRFIELPDQTHLLLRDIMYTNKFKRSLSFFLSRQQPKTITMTHTEAERLLLPHAEFHTIGQGNIVNFDHVSSLVDTSFLMSDNKTLSIPRRRYKELKKVYYQYLLKTMTKGGIV
ncbi:LytR/AlgR family response regulator transcription factor [Enterococcus durans]|uniref:LytR/AlgR family response regulator transcription factor n=1 Tax=Enterococcus durans TaxID=53345 RepID=UPI001D0A7B17|nr:LytTR family DNA-binding domain-containing protein [Enterococcus durans]MCB8506695.1 LytTR family DNA-binding domain-containing protein [Enterococcus durans]MCB8516380.1 LytTR family DNA-binding domain-containing protein [Enterococcus durans]